MCAEMDENISVTTSLSMTLVEPFKKNNQFRKSIMIIIGIDDQGLNCPSLLVTGSVEYLLNE